MDKSTEAAPALGIDQPTSPPSVQSDEKVGDATHTEDGLVVASSTEEEDEQQYVGGFKLAAILASLTLSIFLMLLDTSIISTAIPRITDEFHSLPDVGWYASAYLLASASFQPLTGKIYQKFNTKWSFLIFLGLFEIGSLICGIANSSTMLIIGRAIAGLGASGLIIGSMTIVVACVPLHRRPALIGMVMGISQIGVICGPLIGGALTEYSTWRWCFYINLPVGGVAMIYLSFLEIPEQTKKPPALVVLRSIHRDLDILGFVLLASASIQLLLALQYGGQQFAWGSATIIGLFCGAGATAVAWFIWNKRLGDEALVPLSILGKTVVWAAALTQMGLTSGMLCVTYYLPIYFQAVKGVSPLTSGVYTLPNVVSQIFTAVLVGFLVQRTGYVIPYSLVSTATTAIGTGLYSLFTPTTSAGEWIGIQIFAGAGRGLGVQMGILAVQTVLDQADVSIAVSLLMFAQLTGSSIFTVASNTVFDQSLKHQLALHAPNVDGHRIISAGATGFRSLVRPEDLPGVLLSYANSVDRTFYVPAAVTAVSFVSANFLGWVDLRKKKTAGKGPDKA